MPIQLRSLWIPTALSALMACSSLAPMSEPDKQREPAQIALRPECEQAQVASFFVWGLANFASRLDYCQVSGEPLPPALVGVLTDITNSNEKVAAVLGLRPSELIPQGLSFSLQGGPAGILDSDSRIKIGVYESWNGEPIDQGLYVHELGHVLTEQTEAQTQPHAAMRLFRGNRFFTETVADFFSMATVGAIFDAPFGTAKCAESVRKVNSLQTYNYPVGYFDLNFSVRRLHACCDFLEQHNDQSQFYTTTCPWIRKRVPADSLPPLDRRVFSALSSFDLDELDDHQIGLPMNAYFWNLSRASGKPYGNPLLQILRSEVEAPQVSSLQCVLPEHPDKPTWRANPPILSSKKFFQSVRALSEREAGVALTEQLWQKHRMDFAEKVALKDESLQTPNFVQSAFAAAHPQHSCIADVKSDAPRDPNCLKECRSIPQ